MTKLLQQLSPNYYAESNDDCLIEGSGYRLSVLDKGILRVEIGTIFCNKPTQKVWDRNFSHPKFLLERQGNILKVTTYSHFLYAKEQSKHQVFATFFFNEKSKKMIKIQLADGRIVKNFKKGNLGGTRRTLDGTFGAVKLDDGLVSREGVGVLDDSDSHFIGDSGMIEENKSKNTDIYYFAFGNDYRGAIKAMFKLCGSTPLLPRFCLGNWWSRYRAYTQDEYISLMQKFIDKKIPISVATVDMDWHWVKQVDNGLYDKTVDEGLSNDGWGCTSGWTGYSWDKQLFPDYKNFLKWLKEKNFKVTLNLHPASGVRHFEDMYPEMCAAVGADPSLKARVAFDLTNPKFTNAYFSVIHHPYERDGVDFWWIDWQQGKKTTIKGLDPLWLLNHYHYLDSAKQGKRGLILSRYSGIGSHRYPLGFSGDTATSWKCLSFQPYFTANATNAGYCWWSHDIGGHHLGVKDNELYIRWIQFGVFSPIMRLHSTHNDLMGKEPWHFPRPTQDLATQQLRLRHSLIPYIYSMNYRTHTEGIGLCEPMYYSHPSEEEAYKVGGEYYFGSELIVAPIVEKTDKMTQLSSSKVWLPQGEFTDIFTGKKYIGGRTFTTWRGIESIPVFAKQGAIIPFSTQVEDNNCGTPQELLIWTYSGAANSFNLYEDDGESDKYKDGAFSITKLSCNYGDSVAKFDISPSSNGKFMAIARNFIVVFKDIVFANEITVLINRKIAKYTLLDDDGYAIKVVGVRPIDKVEIYLQGYQISENDSPEQQLEGLYSRLQGGNIRKSAEYKGAKRALEKTVLRGKISKAKIKGKGMKGAVAEIFSDSVITKI